MLFWARQPAAFFLLFGEHRRHFFSFFKCFVKIDGFWIFGRFFKYVFPGFFDSLTTDWRLESHAQLRF